MGDPTEIAKQFVAHYYTTFDTQRANLVGLYVSKPARRGRSRTPRPRR